MSRHSKAQKFQINQQILKNSLAWNWLSCIEQAIKPEDLADSDESDSIVQINYGGKYYVKSPPNYYGRGFNVIDSTGVREWISEYDFMLIFLTLFKEGVKEIELEVKLFLDLGNLIKVIVPCQGLLEAETEHNKELEWANKKYA
jgi:hypothetical protein